MSVVVAVSPAEVGVTVGSIFYSSWGYGQANIDYYKVVGVTPKGVKVVKVGKKTVPPPDGKGHFTYEHVVPDPDVVIPRSRWDIKEGDDPCKPMTKRLKTWGEGERRTVSFTVTSYADAYLWDGKPEYQTASGFGH